MTIIIPGLILVFLLIILAFTMALKAETNEKSSLFPISTYQTLEKDPLALVTNNLSKISANEGGAVQVLIRPLSQLNLRKKGEKALKKIREGTSVREAVVKAYQGFFAEGLEDMVKVFFAKDQKTRESEMQFKEVEKNYDQKGYDAIQSKIQKQPFEANIKIWPPLKTEERP